MPHIYTYFFSHITISIANIYRKAFKHTHTHKSIHLYCLHREIIFYFPLLNLHNTSTPCSNLRVESSGGSWKAFSLAQMEPSFLLWAVGGFRAPWVNMGWRLCCCMCGWGLAGWFRVMSMSIRIIMRIMIPNKDFFFFQVPSTILSFGCFCQVLLNLTSV